MAGSVSKVVDLLSQTDSKHPALNCVLDCVHPRLLKIHLSEPTGHLSSIILFYVDAETPVPPTSRHREIRSLLMRERVCTYLLIPARVPLPFPGLPYSSCSVSCRDNPIVRVPKTSQSYNDRLKKAQQPRILVFNPSTRSFCDILRIRRHISTIAKF